MNYHYEQIGQVCATFACNRKIVPGQVCEIIANNTVAMCNEESNFCGVVAQCQENCASVILRGFVTVPYTGSTPSIGHVPLSGDGDGNVCVCTDAHSYLVTNVDAVNKTITFLL